MVANTARSTNFNHSNSSTKKRKHKTNTSNSLSRLNLAKEIINIVPPLENAEAPETIDESQSTVELIEKYPVFKDHELVKKFTNVSMTNNQKGRIRQLLKDQLKDTANVLLPDVIYNKIQSIIKNSSTLTDPELRKMRILYNMLKKSIQATDEPRKSETKKKKKKKIVKDNVPSVKKDTSKEVEPEQVKDDAKKKILKNPDQLKTPIKKKGPKRYVVFVGNLPTDVTTEMIMNHFWEMNENIVHVRIPKKEEGKKSSIAFVELGNEPSYELALSKHHSMLGSKRINVLYTTQKNGKISKATAKSKSAKIIALQKSGRLAGSLPLNKKRSHRRMIAKRAQSKLASASQ